MANGFVLTAQVNFQSNQNQLKGVVTQLQAALNTAKLNLAINIPSNVQRQLQQLQTSIGNVGKSAHVVNNELEQFGANAAQSLKKFFGFTLVVTTFYTLAQAIKSATHDALDFQHEVVKISQVTGTSVRDLRGLTDEVTRLATTLGVSSKKILEASQVLAQAGLTAEDVKVSLEALAKTEVSPTFDDIISTTEGAIAIMSQFKTTAKDLEKQLGSVNAVSAKFAVESGDIVTAVRRTGGAFKAAGGNLNELIALFTSVRATTRESAESIATGFRTIFTRIQRTRTINFLESFKIQLRDVEGNFKGPLDAIRELSKALKDLDSRDPRFNQIIEELGGFRQVSKVIPLIQQFGDAEKALIVATTGQNSLTRDAVKSNESLARQIAQVREEFTALVRELAGTDTFQALISGALNLSSALIELTRALKPLLPLITIFGALKLGASAQSIASGFGQKLSPLLLNKGGSVGRFASGGMVPGSGSSDTFPAMLTPGEFVIRKKAVQSIGTKKLNELNKFAAGGNSDIDNTPIVMIPGGQFGGAFLFPKQSKDNTFTTALGPKDSAAGITTVANLSRHFIGQDARTTFDNLSRQLLSGTVVSLAGALGGGNAGAANTLGPQQLATILENKADIKSIQGNLFEGAVSAFAGVTSTNLAGGIKNFDFSRAQIPLLSTLFGAGLPTFLDAKRTESREAIKELVNKAISQGDIAKVTTTVGQLSPDMQAVARDSFKKQSSRFASGGPAGTDTIPAMLTPGEFIINQKAASRLGLPFLNKLNNADKVKGFASGGLVGPGSTQIVREPDITDVLQTNVALFVKELRSLGKTVEEIDTRLRRESNPTKRRNFKLAATSQTEVRTALSANLRQALLDDPLADFGLSPAPQVSPLNTISGHHQKPFFARTIPQDENTLEKLTNQALANESSFRTGLLIDEGLGKQKQAKLLQSLLSGNQPSAFALSQRLPAHITGKLQSGGIGAAGGAGGAGGAGASGGATGTPVTGNNLNTNNLLLATAVLPQILNQFTALGSETNKLTSAIANSVTQFATLTFITKQASEIFGKGSQARLDVIQPEIKGLTTNLAGLTAAQSPLQAEIAIDKNRLNRTLTQKQNAEAAAQAFNISGDTKRATENSALARAFSASSQKQDENLQLKLSEVRENQKLIDSGNTLLKTRQKEEAALIQQQKALTSVTLGVSALSSVLSSVGSVVAEGARKDIQAGRFSSSNRFITGSTVSGIGSGAGQGLVGGAALGTVLGGPVIGTAIGAVAGGLIGGVTSFVSASKEAERLINEVKFNDFFKRFNRDLTDLGAGRSSLQLRGGAIRSNISRLEQELLSAPDAQSKESIRGQIESSAVGINTFLEQLAASSSGLDDFKIKAGDSLRIFADFVGIPIEEAIKGFEDNIKAQNKQTEITEQLNTAQLRQFQRLREFNNLTGAIKDTTTAFEVFNTNLDSIEAFAGGNAGATRVGNRGGIFERPEQIIDQQQLASIVAQTASLFGGRAGTLSTEAIQGQDIISRLPEILLNVANQKPFEGDSDFSGRIGKQLKGAPDFVANAILANVADFIGSEAKDERIIDAIQTNVGDVAKKVGGGILEDIFKFFEENASQLANQTNQLASLYDKRRALEQRLIDGIINTIDLNQQAAEFKAEFRDNRVPLGVLQQFDATRQANILGPKNANLANNPEAIGIRLRESENAIIAKNLELETAGSERREQLLKELDAEKTTVDRLNGALRFLTDVTSRNAAIQKELGVLRTRRDAITGVASEFARGGIADRRELAKGALGALLLSKGKNPEELPEAFRAQAFNFLDRFKGSGELNFLGGRKAEDVALDAERRSLVALGFSPEEAARVAKPTPREEKLAKDIGDNFARAISASDILTNSTFQSQLGILSAIENNTAIFRDLLNRNFLQADLKSTQTEAATIGGRLSSNKESLATAIGIANSVRNVGGQGNITTFNGLLNNREIIPGTVKELNDVLKLESSKSFVNQAKELLEARPIGRDIGLADSVLGKDNARRAGQTTNQVLGKLLNQGTDIGTGGITVDEISKLREQAEKRFPGLGSQIFRDIGQKLSFKDGTARSEDFNNLLLESLNKFDEDIKERRLSLDENLSALSASTGLTARQLQELGNNPKFIESLNSLEKGFDFTKVKKETVDLESRLNTLNTTISNITRDLNSIPRPNSAPNPIRRARGGFVGGSGSGDTVSALLTPGEFVLRKSAVDAIGVDALEDMQKFAEGGSVRSRLVKRNRLDVLRQRRADRQALRESRRESNRLNAPDNPLNLVGGRAGIEFANRRQMSLDRVKDDAERSREDRKNRLTSAIDSGSIGGDFAKKLRSQLNNTPLSPTDNPLTSPKAVRQFLSEFASGRGLPFDASIGHLAPNERFSVGLNRVGKNKLDFDFTKPVSRDVALHEFGHNIDDKLGALLGRRGKESVQGNLFNSILEDAKTRILEGSLDLSKQSGLDRNSLLSKPQELFAALFAHPEEGKRITDLIRKSGAKFAAGGMVPGRGAGDTVPAMLTPGEFVLKKSAVNAIGLDNLHMLNNIQQFANGGQVQKQSSRAITANANFFKQFIEANKILFGAGSDNKKKKFAAGGFVTGGISDNTLMAFSSFNSNINRLSVALDNFPREITGSFSHRVEVIHNGTQMFAGMQESIIRLVEATAIRSINNMIKSKFPDVGTVA
jgi:TP901 family phage tail tape measure protein